MKKKSLDSPEKSKKPTQSGISDDPVERFNLNILRSERMRMVKLQTKCSRERRVCNLSEVLRAGIAAMEKLSESEVEKIIKELEDL